MTTPRGTNGERPIPTSRQAKHRRWMGIALTVTVIGLGIWVWEDVLADRLIPKRWGAVEDGRIYRSGRLSASLVARTLRKHDIRVIVDLTGRVPANKDQAAEIAAAAEQGIELLRYPLGGNGTGDIRHYAQAIAAIVQARAADRPVLVHCAAGSQRTGGVIACYRMLVEKRSGRFAFDEMRRYDWDPVDDTAVRVYVNENIGDLATLLIDMGDLDAIPNPLPQLPER